VDNAGAIHEPSQEFPRIEIGRDTGPSRPHIASFPDVDPARIVEFRFQICGTRWMEFRNVSLIPGRQTNVETVDANSSNGEAADGQPAELRRLRK